MENPIEPEAFWYEDLAAERPRQLYRRHNPWKKIAVALARDFSPTLGCNELHHEKADRHESNEPCPVMARRVQALNDFEAMLKAEEND